MADFVANTHSTIVGTPGEDRLTVTWSLGALSFLGSLTPNPAGGYDGHFSTGYAGEGVYFSGIEHFTFEDLAGASNRIYTGSGDDVLLGGGGDDTLDVGSGDDHADGGAGTDMFGADLSAWTNAAVIDLNGVSTLISGTVSNMEGFYDLVTGSGDDIITGHSSSYLSDTISTGAGDDLIQLWSNRDQDVVDGGEGQDRLSIVADWHLSFIYSPTANPVSGYDGHFSTGYSGEGVYFAGIEHFTFEDRVDEDNRIITGSGDDVLLGGGGDDTLLVGSGDDTVDGGAGIDRFGADLSGWTDAAVINLNGVSTLINGTVRNMEGFDDLVTGSGDDIITGHSSSYLSDTISTGAGDDLIQLWSNRDQDVVDGGVGQDRLSIVADWHLSFIYSPTPNPISGYDGHFSTGYSGEGVYFSGIEHFTFEDRADEDNRIITGPGDDVLFGGGGDDTLLVGSGDDTVDGGTGTDMFGADLSAWTDAAVINLNRASTLINGTVSNMEGFESLVTGAGDDSVIGHRFSFVSDEIDTGAGNDRIRLWWNGEADTVVAGEGSDRLTVVASDFMYLGGLTEDAGGGYSGSFSTGYAGEGVYFSGIEHFTFTDRAAADNTITTGAGIDVIRAGGGDDVLDGGGGNDPLSGGPGRDQLMGGVGNDRLDGGAMNDILDGGAGRDELTGSLGNDRLTGGEHADQFIFNSGDGSDVIVDFGIGADLIVIGEGAEGFGDVTIAGAGADTIVQFDDVTIRLIDVDHLTVDADDFLFV